MKYIHLICLACLLLLGSCKSYLDLVPEEDIQSLESIFERRETVEKWLFSAYTYIMKDGSCVVNPATTGADEFVAGPYLRQPYYVEIMDFVGLYIGDGLQMSMTPYGNIWDKSNNGGHYEGIRYCNDFLSNIKYTRNMSEREKKEWIAEIKALKAYLYFSLVRAYGPIVLVPENIGTQTPVEEMYVPRSHVDACFEEIVKLLDEALVDIPSEGDKEVQYKAYFGKESVLALKAKALLLQASPLFNGNTAYTNFKDHNGNLLTNTTYDHEKWKIAAEAVDEAVAYCESRGKKLINLKEENSRATPLLNTMMDIENASLPVGWDTDELIFGIKYNHQLAKYYKFGLPTDLVASLYGGLAPSIKMVEMFYTENGLPLLNDNEWNVADMYTMGPLELDAKYTNVIPSNEQVLNLHLKREPRFYANVAFDRGYWQRGPTQDDNHLVKCYLHEKVSIGGTDFWYSSMFDKLQSTTGQNWTGYYLKKFSHSFIAARSYSTGHESKGDHPFPIIRMAELYLMQAEAWNEYYDSPVGHEDQIYAPLNKVRARAGIPDVEIAWLQHSNDPGRVTSQKGMRNIIHQEYNVEFAFEGHRFWNLRRWLEADVLNEPLKGWDILSDNQRGFYCNFEGPKIVWSKRKFQAPRDYLFPIKSEEVLISNLVQNPGW